ncbi:MAG: transaldolase family protein [Candidatus Omnitrophota bacterium]
MKRMTKVLAWLLSFTLIFQQAGFAQMLGELNIGRFLVGAQSASFADQYRPLHLRFFSSDNLSGNFRLFLDKGSEKDLKDNELTAKTQEIFKYFLIGITLPNDTFWVNLKPDSQDRIIDKYLAKTDVGKIMLAADLQLKKDMAAFTSPQTPQGKEYWNKIYKKAGELFGSENVTIPTLTRPWIVPNEVIIRYTGDSAYVYKATLKVMLEQDYLKNSADYNFKDARLKQLNEYASELVRKDIIPDLTKEVNSSQRYAQLRQVYYSLILAQWFKGHSGTSNAYYKGKIDSRDLSGLESKESWSKNTYFQEYKKSFSNGEYNISEPVHTAAGQVIRNYFSGGIQINPAAVIQQMQFAAGTPGTLTNALAGSGMVAFDADTKGNTKLARGASPAVEVANSEFTEGIKTAIGENNFAAVQLSQGKAKQVGFTLDTTMVYKKADGVTSDYAQPGEISVKEQKIKLASEQLEIIKKAVDKLGIASQLAGITLVFIPGQQPHYGLGRPQIYLGVDFLTDYNDKLRYQLAQLDPLLKERMRVLEELASLNKAYIKQIEDTKTNPESRSDKLKKAIIKTQKQVRDQLRFEFRSGSSPAVAGEEVVNSIRTLSNIGRKRILEAVFKANSGHLGGSLSVVDMLTVLRFGKIVKEGPNGLETQNLMNYDPTDPNWENRDRLAISAGHKAPAEYATLVAAGFFDEKELEGLRQSPKGMLQGHLTKGKTPGVDISGGPLGQGVSKAAGMAYGAKVLKKDGLTVWSIVGGGSSSEGEVTEGIQHAIALNLNNLVIVIDDNKYGIDGEDIVKVNPAKYEAMGCRVLEIKDGHDHAEILQVFSDAKNNPTQKPTVVIAHTIKGKGVTEFEKNGAKYHGAVPKDAGIRQQALHEVEAAIGSYDEAALKKFAQEHQLTAVNKEAVNKKYLAAANPQLSEEQKRELEKEQAKWAEKRKDIALKVLKPGDMMSTRAAFGNFLDVYGNMYSTVVAGSADLTESNSMHLFAEHFPEQYIHFPISEAHEVDFAVGLSEMGLTPFVGTFDVFASTNMLPPLRLAVQTGVFLVVVATHSGVGVGEDGASHQGVESPAIMRILSGPDGDKLVFGEPADGQETQILTPLLVNEGKTESKPVYLRYTRQDVEVVDKSHVKDYEKKLLEGSYVLADPGNGKNDLEIVASGAMVANALKFSQAAAKQGINVKVINVVSLNKIDNPGNPFASYLENGTPVMTVCDAYADGLNDAVLSAINKAKMVDPGFNPGMVRGHGVTVLGSGSTKTMYKINKLDVEGITGIAKNMLAAPRLPVATRQQIKTDALKQQFLLAQERGLSVFAFRRLIELEKSGVTEINGQAISELKTTVYEAAKRQVGPLGRLALDNEFFVSYDGISPNSIKDTPTMQKRDAMMNNTTNGPIILSNKDFLVIQTKYLIEKQGLLPLEEVYEQVVAEHLVREAALEMLSVVDVREPGGVSIEIRSHLTDVDMMLAEALRLAKRVGIPQAVMNKIPASGSVNPATGEFEGPGIETIKRAIEEGLYPNVTVVFCFQKQIKAVAKAVAEGLQARIIRLRKEGKNDAEITAEMIKFKSFISYFVSRITTLLMNDKTVIEQIKNANTKEEKLRLLHLTLDAAAAFYVDAHEIFLAELDKAGFKEAKAFGAKPTIELDASTGEKAIKESSELVKALTEGEGAIAVDDLAKVLLIEKRENQYQNWGYNVFRMARPGSMDTIPVAVYDKIAAGQGSTDVKAMTLEEARGILKDAKSLFNLDDARWEAMGAQLLKDGIDSFIVAEQTLRLAFLEVLVGEAINKRDFKYALAQIEAVASVVKDVKGADAIRARVAELRDRVVKIGMMPEGLIEKKKGVKGNWFLGFDSSTQATVFVVYDMDTKEVIWQWEESYTDEYYKGFNAPGGNLPNDDNLKRYQADPRMAAAALDKGFREVGNAFKIYGWDMSNIKQIGLGVQQHATVSLNKDASNIFQNLDPNRPLSEQIGGGLSRNVMHIWKDKTTEKQQKEVEDFFGGPELLRQLTGSSGELRFLLLQMLKWYEEDKTAYENTATIVTLAGFLGSLLNGGKFFFDPGEALGTNAADVRTKQWVPDIDKLVPGLTGKLAQIKPTDSTTGTISPYWTKYGFSPETKIANATGDNPAAMLGQSILGAGQIAFSLGSSFTVKTHLTEEELKKTLTTKIGNVFGTPTGEWMKLLCIQNGAQALDAVRDEFIKDDEAIARLNADGKQSSQYSAAEWKEQINNMKWKIFREEATKADVPVGSNGAMMITQITQEEVVRIPYIPGHPFTRNVDLSTLTRGQRMRLALEGQVYLLKWVADQIGLDVKVINLTGGAANDPLVRQTMADVFNAKIEVLEFPEGKQYFNPKEAVAIGAAINAAKAYMDAQGTPMTWQQVIEGLFAFGGKKTTLPNEHNVEIYKQDYPQFDALVKDAMAYVPDQAASTDQKASSPSGKADDKTGGIDFRYINMVTQAQLISMRDNFKMPQLSKLKAIDVDKEKAELDKMLAAKILPSSDRVINYVSACYLRSGNDTDMSSGMSCLVDYFRLEESLDADSAPQLKAFLAVIESDRLSI